MKKSFFGGLMLFCSWAYGLDNTVKLSSDHIINLGVITGELKIAPQIPLFYAPAKVIVPPEHEFVIGSSYAGLITQLYVGIGDPVAKGEIVAEIDSPNLLTLQTQYLKAHHALQLIETLYQRDKALAKEGVIAKRRELESFNNYQIAVFDLNEIKQQLEIAGMTGKDIAELEKTQRLSSRLKIYSPIKGVITERIATSGERIDNLTPLYRVADLSILWLRINIPQERVNDVSVGDMAIVENTDVSAPISVIGKSVTPEDQTLLARAMIKGKPLAIHAGQNTSVQVVKANKYGKIRFIIPHSAVIQNEGQNFIFVSSKDGFTVLPIDVVGKQENEFIITGELTGKEKIAVKGTVALKANWLGLGSE